MPPGLTCSTAPRDEARIDWVAPADLLHPSRLDLVAKWFFFRSLLGHDDFLDAGALYRWHIERRLLAIGDSGKRSPADYEAAARDLLVSVQAHGFDGERPVPLSSQGTPLDGAHRLAVGLVLGRAVPIRAEGRAPSAPWDYAWLLRHECPVAWLNRIVQAFVRLASASRLVLWWRGDVPMMEQPRGWREVAWRRVNVPRTAVESLLHDVYGTAVGPGPHPTIEQKARRLGVAGLPVRASLVMPDGSGRPQDLRAWKQALRERRAQGFDICHTSDTPIETRLLVGMFFSENYRRQLLRRTAHRARPVYLDRLAKYRTALAGLDIPADRACVVGSAALEPLDLRPSTDVDCVLASEIREPRFGPGICRLSDGVDLVAASYHRAEGARVRLSDDRLVADPEWHHCYRGALMANPEVVLDRKRVQARPKDLRDVRLFEERLRVGRRRQRPRPSRGQLVLGWAPQAPRGWTDRFWEELEWGLREAGGVLVLAGTVGGALGMPVFAPPPRGWVDEDLWSFAREVLDAAGVDADELLAHVERADGPPRDDDHARQRVCELATVVRWQAAVVTEVDPEVAFVLSTGAAEDLTVARLAERRRIPVVKARLSAVDDLLVVEGAGCGSGLDTATYAGDPDREGADLPGPRALAERLLPIARRSHAGRVRLQSVPSLVRQFAERARLIEAAMAPRVEPRTDDDRRNHVLVRAGRAARSRPLWVWGAGEAGRRLLADLDALGVEVVGVVHGAATPAGVADPARLVSPGEFARAAASHPRPFVVVASMFASEIGERLDGLALVAGDDYLVAP